jgi:protein-S-isoprenylcysteine O-methyltransferase Ste14
MKARKSENLLALFGTIIFLFLLLPIFLIWIPNRILSSPEYSYSFNAGGFKYFGMVPISIGFIIYIWCSNSFVTHGKGSPIPFTPTKRLVVTGLYRFVRNPLYIAGSLVLAGEALLFQSLGILIYCLVMFAIFNIHVFMEEKLLADQFGETYEQYRKSVPRWIPRLKPYRNNGID